jgi:hypothetical protein
MLGKVQEVEQTDLYTFIEVYAKIRGEEQDKLAAMKAQK